EGPAAGITISGNDASRVFNVSAGTVQLYRLTIAHGRASGDTFGGNNSGVGIFNTATVTLTDCTLSNNTAFNTGPNASGGGAIWNIGPLTVSGSTFTGNTATGPNSFGGEGGA